MDRRNGYMLGGRLGRRGYDWWWHSLVGISQTTGEKQPFFIEYFFVNPHLATDMPVFGQLPANRDSGIAPSYGMIKAGTWAEGKAVQIHNFFPFSACRADSGKMDLRIGDSTASETALQGAVRLSEVEAVAHPEYLSGAGEMSWNLSARKRISWSVGWGTSALMRWLDAFEMYWHVPGMRTDYEGTITYNGQVFRVEADTCAGYQDKNWGRDFTSPWVWLNCNNLRDNQTGKVEPDASLDVGGGRPVVFGHAFPRRLLVAFSRHGELYQWNFSRFWTGAKQRFKCTVGDRDIRWQIEAWDRRRRIVIDFRCPRNRMLRVNYENPRGEWRHRQLWNGGHAAGTVLLYRRQGRTWMEEASYTGDFGGCEYGEYTD